MACGPNFFGSSGGDPYFSNVVLLSLLENSLADVKGHTAVPNGTQQYATTPLLFGGYSWKGPGQSSGYFFRYQDTTPTSTLGLGAGDFTIEIWVYLTGRSSTWGTHLFAGGASGTEIAPFMIVTSSGLLQCGIRGTGGVTLTAAGTVPLNTWQYIGLSRVGSTVSQSLHGTITASGTSSATCVCSGYVRFGTSYNGASTTNIPGYLDSFRITKGVARDITSVPTAAFPTS
jgi:hypothetical protein